MIDWTRVRELRAEIGDEDFGEVAELFLAEVDEAITGLEAAADTAGLQERLHFLKGAALNLGFSALAELCADGERRARQAPTARVSLAPLVQCFHASRDVFVAHVPDIAA